MIVGAGLSAGKYFLASNALPSMALPIGSIILPKSSGPTGISATLLVPLTLSPTLTASALSKSTAPTPSSLRSKAIPKISPSNSKSSP